MSRLFLIAGVVGLAAGVWRYVSGGSTASYSVLAIGGTFWLVCAAISFFLRNRLA